MLSCTTADLSLLRTFFQYTHIFIKRQLKHLMSTDKNVKNEEMNIYLETFTSSYQICCTIGNTRITYTPVASSKINTWKSTGSASPERRGICRRGLSEIYKVRVALNTVIKSPASFRPPTSTQPLWVQTCLSRQPLRTVSSFQPGRLSSASKLRIKRKQLVSPPPLPPSSSVSPRPFGTRYLDSSGRRRRDIYFKVDWDSFQGGKRKPFARSRNY